MSCALTTRICTLPAVSFAGCDTVKPVADSAVATGISVHVAPPSTVTNTCDMSLASMALLPVGFSFTTISVAVSLALLNATSCTSVLPSYLLSLFTTAVGRSSFGVLPFGAVGGVVGGVTGGVTGVGGVMVEPSSTIVPVPVPVLLSATCFGV